MIPQHLSPTRQRGKGGNPSLARRAKVQDHARSFRSSAQRRLAVPDSLPENSWRPRKPAYHLPLLRRPTILHGTCTNGPTPGKGTFTMASEKKIRVGIVGLGFGAEFIPIYQAHPNAEMYAVCRRNEAELDKCGDRFGVKVRYTNFAD